MQPSHHDEPGEHVPERPEPRRQPEAATRKSWTPPRIDDLPRLENLTLQTSVGTPIDGNSGSIFP
jgi:hypothetical protein